VSVTDTLSSSAAARAAQPASGGITTVSGRLPLVVWFYLLAVVIPIGMQVGPLLMTSLRLILMVMILPVLFNLFTGKYGKIVATDIFFVLHLTWATMALLVNNPGAVIEQTGSTGAEFLGGYALGRAYVRSREDFAALVRALCIIVLVMFPFAVFETLTSRSLLLEFLRALPAVRTVLEVHAEARNLFGVSLERVQMGFAHPIHFGLFCSVAFSLCVVGMKGIFNTPRRIMSGFALALAGILSLSSGALLSIVLQLGLISWALVLAKVNARWWILLGIFALAYIAIDIVSTRTPLRVFMSYATFSAHNAFWRAIIFEWGMINVWANPIFGIGLNDWVRPSYMPSGSVDNFWLLTTMRYGIPAFLFLMVGYLLVMFHLLRRDFSQDQVLANFRRAWMFTFLGLTFTLCTVHVWSAIYSFTFFMLGSGVWMMFAQPDSDETPSEATTTAAKRDVRVFARRFADPDSASPNTSTSPKFSRFGGTEPPHDYKR